MKIALNAITFRPGQMGGLETYFRNVFSSLQEVDAGNRYSLVCDRRYSRELAISNPNFSVHPCNFTRPSLGWLTRGVIRNALGFDILRPVFNRLESDIIHHPFSILNPLRLKIPSVLTFHDMQHEFYPEYFSSFEIKIRKEFYRPSAEQADRIIAISEHAKSTLVDVYQIDPEKIDVIYNGFNSAFRVIDDLDRLREVKQKYGLQQNFMYYPAATWPHKNHHMLLSAIKLLKDRYRFDGQLVLTGISMSSNNEVLREIGRLNLEETVLPLGYLPEDELPCLYNMARLLVFPSLYEGFGIPLVEAMACGCPVACSDRTSIPEVIGGAGELFDPASIEDMAEKIYLLWCDDEKLNLLRTRGLRRAGSKIFSWLNTAKRTVEVYGRVVQNP